MLDKIINVSAGLFLIGIMSFGLSLFNLQFKFMSFLGEFKSIFDYAAMGLGFVVCIVASQIKRKRKNEKE